MPLAKIPVPTDLNKRAFSQPSENAIDEAHEAIERFMLADVHFFDNFVNCDFHLVDQAISWVVESHLLAGNRFLEFGSGFGAATILASLHGLEAVGIEIEQPLVDEANKLADHIWRQTCSTWIHRLETSTSKWNLASRILIWCLHFHGQAKMDFSKQCLNEPPRKEHSS